MPRKPSNRIPKYRHHKPSGQAVVTLDGRDVYLGAYTDAASRQRYERVVGEWLANGRQLSIQQTDEDPLTVDELLAAFWRHAQVHYRSPSGEPTSELDSFTQAFKPLRSLYSNAPARDFGPLALRAVREKMISDGWARGYKVTAVQGAQCAIKGEFYRKRIRYRLNNVPHAAVRFRSRFAASRMIVRSQLGVISPI